MMRLNLAFILSLTLLLTGGDICFANSGIFSGSGHTVELSSTDSIQMVSEDVTIIPHLKSDYSGNDPYSPVIEYIDYHCVFYLKNLEGTQQTIQVGFPLDAQSIKLGMKKDQALTEELSQYHFVARDEDMQYEVRYVVGDWRQELEHLFLWDMQFSPGESKTLEVSYTLPASLGVGATDTGGWKTPYEKEMFLALGACIYVHFGYVTETGKSWSGPIEKASFRVYLKELETYLLKRPLVKSESDDVKSMKSIPNPIALMIDTPEGWAMNDEGYLTMEVFNYTPTENFHFGYRLLPGFQRTLEGTWRILFQFNKNSWNSENYFDYIDILKEYNGIKTNNPRIQPFLNNQVWYGKEKFQYIPSTVIWVNEFIVRTLKLWKEGMGLLEGIMDHNRSHEKKDPELTRTSKSIS